MSRFFYPRVLMLSLAGWVGFVILTVLALGTTYLPGDLAVARWVQSVSWGPLAATFPWISLLTGTDQVIVAVTLVVVVAALNVRAVPFAILSALAAALYILVNLLFHKARPLAGPISVTEHLGSFSFPSGHATLTFAVVGVLVLAIGFRFFGPVLLALGSALGVLVVLTIGIERVYVGAHYPSDVLGGYLLAFATIALALSIKWVGEPVVSRILSYGAARAGW